MMKMKIWPLIIGFGLALSPIHNQWLTDLATNSKGETLFFLPTLGYLMWILGAGFFLVNNWDRVKEIGWGDRKLVIPLFIVILAMGISGFVNADGISDRVAPLFMGLSLFAIYLTARVLGKDVFIALIPFVILSTVISVVNGIIHPGVFAADVGSAVLITNYCAAAGYLIFGGIVNQGRWQWILLVIMLVGVFFVGVLEAVFILGVLGLVVLVRQDFGKPFIITAGVLMLIAGIWLSLGHLMTLYTGNHNVEILRDIVVGNIPLTNDSVNQLTSGRWIVILNALQDIGLFGHGYSLSTVSGGIVHNIPLIVIHQIGWVGGLAWLFVMVWCLIKTRWKYAWIAVLAMGVFDHYLWTQFPPYVWALMGVSTTSTISCDLIFRKPKTGVVIQ